MKEIPLTPVASSQVNISLDEYTNMMGLYLQQLKDSSSSDHTSIPKLYTFNSGEWIKPYLTADDMQI